MTRKYELMYILNPVTGEEELNALNERIKTLLETNGTVENIDLWGKKRLAYEIDDQREGFYGLIHFSAEAEAPKEIERNLKITDGVMRYLIIRADD